MVATGLATEVQRPGSAEVLRRLEGPTHGPTFWFALWAMTVTAVVVTVVLPVIEGGPQMKERAVVGAIAGTFAGCGLIAWRRRPDSRSGLWMVAVGFGLFVGPLLAGFESPVIQEFNDLLDDFWTIAIIALLLTFTSGGRLESTADRVLVGAMVLQVTVQIARELFLAHDGNFLLVHPNRGVADALEAASGLIIVFACVGTAVVIGAASSARRHRCGGRCCRAWPGSPRCSSRRWHSRRRPGIRSCGSCSPRSCSCRWSSSRACCTRASHEAV